VLFRSLNATAQVLLDPHVFDVVPKECATLVVPHVLRDLVPGAGAGAGEEEKERDVIVITDDRFFLDQVAGARSPICFVESGPSSIVPSSWTIREIRVRLDPRALPSPGARTFTPLTEGFILSDVRSGGGSTQHLTYTPDVAPSSKGDRAYLACASDIIRRGLPRRDRTGTGTIGVFGQQMRFDLQRDCFPLLTTKAVPFKAVIRELPEPFQLSAKRVKLRERLGVLRLSHGYTLGLLVKLSRVPARAAASLCRHARDAVFHDAWDSGSGRCRFL
jgi:hypothetical protein